ncbi:Uncharacterised protein [Mycobacterium tuberculosis]|nr:Uncharacterised protein [Mycobacterium tuberculosis]
MIPVSPCHALCNAACSTAISAPKLCSVPAYPAISPA